MQVGSGRVFVCYTVFASPFIASFYDQDLLVPVLRALSITLFFGAVNSIQIAVISRNMQFKNCFTVTLVP